MWVERASIFCIRYMPTLRTPVCGSLVITAGRVMNGAGSPGQQRWIGSRPRSTSSPVRTSSWLAPRETVFGSESAIDFSFFSPRTLSTRPCGGCISSTSSSLAETSSSRSTPKAMHMRRSVPNWLIRSAWLEPRGFSNRSAGPPLFTVRSTISVISRSGSTSASTRTSSPSSSSRRIHARRSAGGATRPSLRTWVTQLRRAERRNVRTAAYASCPRRRASPRSGLRVLVTAAAAATSCTGELAEGDHADEDQPDDEHAGDDVLPLFGGVRDEPGGHGPSLTDAFGVRAQAALDRLRTGLAAKPACAGHPGLAVGVCVLAVGAESGARGDHVRQGRDRLELPRGGDPDEPVRVEVVTEQEPDVLVRGREEARPAVMEQVTLVDRLDAERELLGHQVAEESDPL